MGGTVTGFVGRVDETNELLETVKAGRAVVVTGRAGVGKTRLVAEVAAQLAASGWDTVVRHATPALQSVPLGLFSDLVDPAAQSSDAAAIAQRAIHTRLTSGRSVLVVDDAPLIDAASAVVIQRLVENGDVPVLLTCRTGEALPDSLAAVQASNALHTRQLDGLTSSAAQQLAHDTAQGALADTDAQQIAERAEGIPLFIIALVRERLGGGTWSTTMDTSVDNWLSRLAPAQRTALELVALGSPLELSIFDRLCDPATSEELEGRTLLEIDVSRRRHYVRLHHPLYGQILTQRISTLRGRRLLRDLAGALRSTRMARADDLLRAVLWNLDAGDPVPPSEIVRAARYAIGRGGVAEAERLASIVIGPDGTERADGASDDDVLDAAGILVSIRLEQMRPAEVAPIYHSAPKHGSEELRARLAILAEIALFHYLGDKDGAIAVLDEAGGALSPPWNLEVKYNRMAVEFYAGDTAHAARIVDAMLTEEELPERTWAWYMAPGVLTLSTVGRTQEAVDHGRRCIELASKYTEILGIEDHALTTWAYATVLHSGPNDCEAAVLARQEAIKDSGDHVSLGFLQMMRGFTLLHRARLRDAIPLLEMPEGFPGGWPLWTAALRAQAFALIGDRRAAIEQHDRLAVIPQCSFHESHNHYATGEIALLDGDNEAAISAFTRGAKHAEALSQQQFAAHGWMRALAVSGDDTHAQQLSTAAGRIDGPAGRAMAAAAEGWLRRQPHSIAEAATDVERHGNQLYGLHIRGIHLRQLSSSESAVGQTRRAQAQLDTLWARARGLRTQPRRRADRVARGTWDVLTERERQIADLAHAGSTDQEIGTALAISVRTVHAHLRTIYRKLGVTGRRDLGDLPR